VKTEGSGARRPRDRRDDETRLRAIVDHVADGIVIVDAQGEVRFANSAAEALFGRSAPELLGEPFGFPVVAGASTEIDILRKSGETVVAELRAVEIDWEREPALLISLRDVTDRKRAEEQARDLAREQAARAEAEAAERRYRMLAEEKATLAEENAWLYQQAQEASRTKSEFLAVMSHELRTPLNAIIGYTDLLELGISGAVSEPQREHLDRIKASSQHLLELVNDILTFSRLEAGREEVHPEPVDYVDLVREVAALAEPLADRKHLSLRVEAPEHPCPGETDARKVRQILLNLLSNATKFTDQGGVRLEAEESEDRIIFRVRDTGIGIPRERLAQIWEPFWQVEQSQTRTADGTGLGLSVVRRLTNLLGGRVDVASTPGEGSAFTVSLPLRVCARGAHDVGEGERGNPGAARAPWLPGTEGKAGHG
jgi:signal transduction histidine kinase